MARVKSDIRWELLEAAWAAGIKTPRQMSSEYEALTGQKVSHEGIRKHFNELGMARDLKGRIKQRAQELVDKQLAEGKLRLPTATEKQIVEVAARTQADVTVKHRDLISTAFDRVKGCFAELQAEELGARIDGIKKLTDSLKTLVGLERQAYGMADNANGEADKPEDKPAAEMNTDVARRIAFVLTNAARGV